MTGLRLNLGCGAKRLPGFVNVDRFGEPDVKHNLETFPWPWPDNSVSEIVLVHVLEHLGHHPDVFLGIFKEMYRICMPDAKITIVVPHPRHDNMYDDPTHVRGITPTTLSLFSQKLNKSWIAQGIPNTTLGLFLEVDFEITHISYKPSPHWYRLHPEPTVNLELLLAESALYNNLIVHTEMVLKAVK